MVITASSSAQLLAVIGSTGTQGGSVVRALAASETQYRVRAITRDDSKPAAKDLADLGCEVVVADVGTSEGVYRAFEGADLAFLFTTSLPFDPDGKAKEFKLGKLQFDAAKQAGVKTVAWSGVPSTTKHSDGKYVCDMFDIKAELADYARSLQAFEFIDVLTGTYATNYLTQSAPRKQDDGTYVLAAIVATDTLLPVIDIAADYGGYVIGAVEKGGVETVYAAPRYITPTQIAEEFSKFSGKQVVARQIPDDAFRAHISGFAGEHGASTMTAMFQYMREVGYYAGHDLEQSNTLLSSPGRTFSEFLQANKTEVDKLFA